MTPGSFVIESTKEMLSSIKLFCVTCGNERNLVCILLLAVGAPEITGEEGQTLKRKDQSSGLLSLIFVIFFLFFKWKLKHSCKF